MLQRGRLPLVLVTRVWTYAERTRSLGLGATIHHHRGMKGLWVKGYIRVDLYPRDRQKNFWSSASNIYFWFLNPGFLVEKCDPIFFRSAIAQDSKRYHHSNPNKLKEKNHRKRCRHECRGSLHIFLLKGPDCSLLYFLPSDYRIFFLG